MADEFDSDDGTSTESVTQPLDPPTGSPGGFGPRSHEWHRRRYRIAVVAFATLGVVMGVAGITVENGREVLFALFGIGLFGAVLCYILIPERFVPASLGWRTYAPLAEVGPLFVTTLELSDRRVYLPTSDGQVRLLVPQNDDFLDDCETPVIGVHETKDTRELVLPTTGDELLTEFREQHGEALAADAPSLIDQLLDVLVEEFELVERANGQVESTEDRVVVTVERSYYGPPTSFDHPVAAFLAAGLAAGLETAVGLESVRREADGRYVIICFWGR
ncbi:MULTISPECIES: hypothetical protein [Halococcus]|uniref:DUF7982 domain-containing protein n=1 Tax=Halococcus salifodinae DSM 8989 TaxID=1227456 RepID=M0N8S8_9EURY|nr:MULTISPECIES: hypothetical protein [Halococcus]EMA53035.1 hypothetical protein C450_09473 [Halococcus salifodinae DSM 8989]